MDLASLDRSHHQRHLRRHHRVILPPTCQSRTLPICERVVTAVLMQQPRHEPFRGRQPRTQGLPSSNPTARQSSRQSGFNKGESGYSTSVLYGILSRNSAEEENKDYDATDQKGASPWSATASVTQGSSCGDRRTWPKGRDGQPTSSKSSRRLKRLANLLLFLAAHALTAPSSRSVESHYRLCPSLRRAAQRHGPPPTNADTRPNNVSAERQAITMRTMFRNIEEAHRDYGSPLSNYPYAEQGEYIDPGVLPLNSFNRVDQYVWAVLRARNSPEIIRDNFTCLVLPHLNTERGFIQCGQADVMWFLRGWNFYERDSNGQWGWRY